MSEVTTAVLIFTAVGVLFVALGIPLLKGRVPPNAWYGCRTRKTLSDEKTWYAVNRVTGRSMIGGGAGMILGSLLVLAFGRGMDPDYAVVVLLAVLSLSLIVMVVRSHAALRRA